MITATALVAHAIGDYVLQSDWMATEKAHRKLAALVHAVTYTLPFLFLTRSWTALFVIAVSHFYIDHYRLARYVCWVKNWVGIPREVIEAGGPTRDWSKVNLPWKQCKATGYSPDKPIWMSVWLMIITDNVMHVLCNGVALWRLG